MNANDPQIYTCSLLQARASIDWIALYKRSRATGLEAARQASSQPAPPSSTSAWGFWAWPSFASLSKSQPVQAIG